MLQIHNLQPSKGAKRTYKRVGRGAASGRGTTAGRGGKGQTARSGGSRGLWIKAYKAQLQSTPKLRGFTSIATKPAEVYLYELEKHFAAGATVDIAALKEKNLIGDNVKAVKVILKGDLTKKLSLVGLSATKGAAAKIAAVGGELK